MIISKIIGGLGNQMFQYAAGRALSLERGVAYHLDVSGFAGYALHQGFELERVFAAVAEEATEQDVQALLGWQARAGVRRLLARPALGALRNSRYVLEPHFQYWDGLRETGPDAYLEGYWQSEKYFAAHSATLRRDFSFKLPMDERNAALAGQMAQANSVSLHVRRGDYANNAQTTATHGLCSLDYFRSAIRHIAERVAQPSFFIFSDDIAWVRQNLQIDFPHAFVDHNHGADSYNDMRLMSLCKNHIIANSSFSWWGAWLNPDPGKHVVAPRQWFANQNKVSDLLPSAWVTL